MVEFNEGKSRTVSGKTSVSVIGLGYVGFHRACLCARKVFTTFCIDTNYAKVGLINQDLCPVDDKELRELFKQGKIVATASFKVTSNTDVLVIYAPKPVSKNHKPNLKPLKGACQSIMNYFRKGHLPVIDSTVNPGVCEEMAKSFGAMGIAVLEIIKTASAKPFSFLPHYLGCGAGRQWIPVDPYYSTRQA